jgi:hypothetical protein
MFRFLAAASISIALSSCMSAPAPSPGFGDDRPAIPIRYVRASSHEDLVVKCFDGGSLFAPGYGKRATFCVRQTRTACIVTLPHDWSGDRRQIYAACNNWSPRV